MKKLNLGSGESPLDGYENLDRKNGQEVYPLDYPDAYADEIRASHILEHFSHQEVRDVLAEWIRVLKPGGLLRIAVPHFDLICEMHQRGAPINAQAYLMGGHIDGDDRHGALFSVRDLCGLLHDAGLERVRQWESDHDDTARLDISLNVEARKPLVAKGTLEFAGVRMVLPTPRYGPSAHHKCIYEALGALTMTMHTVGGCFWNQHLSEAIEDEIAHDDCRYVLTLDYDSVFSTQDVVDMYRIMETHPHIDALVPIQSHRGVPVPLFTVEGATQIDMRALDPLTMPISTGHFGLTFLRADKLRELPRPWMMPRTNDAGRWGVGHVDPDIAFWAHWRETGHQVHLANHVTIGHIDDMVLWPSKEDLTPIYQKVGDYMQHGKPMEAR